VACLIQNSTQVTAIWSKSQSAEEFQYGGRFYVKSEVVIYQPSTKFGLWIDFDIRIKVTSSNTKRK